jgi:aromatic ring-opening dioxygenase LigB subunit
MTSDSEGTIDRGNALAFGAFVPHPPILLPEIGGAESAQVKSTFEACEGIAVTLKEMGCGTLVMSSPHMAGISAVPGVFRGSVSGSLSKFGAPGLRFEFETDSAFCDLLASLGDEAGVTLRTIGGDDGGKAPSLDHGLTVFLYFLNKIGYSPKVCFITPAYSSYLDNFQYGRLLASAMASHDRKCAFVASGDLSHRLKPGAPAGFDPRGSEFDETYCRAMRERDYESIIDMDDGLIESAGVCGHVTMLMQLGSALSLGLESRFVSYEGPWGVGYLVSRFEPSDAN